MASQLGSAVTTGGHQAFQDQVQTENANRAMGQQAMAQQQQMGMAQQQMQQDYDISQQKMQQDAEQFGASREEADIQRQFQLKRDEKAFQVSAEQDEIHRKWADGRYQKDQQFQLELQRIDLLADQAKAKGQQDVFAKLIGLRQETNKRKASNAAEISLVNSLRGKTKRQTQEMLNSYAQQIEQMMSAAQHDQELSKNFAPTLRGSILGESSETSKAAFDQLFQAQMDVTTSPLSQPDQLLFGSGLNREKTLSDAGQLRGLEFLKLNASRYIFSGLSPFNTRTAEMAGDKVDAATMTTMMQDRLVRGAIKTLKSMPLKNFDEKTAEQALRVAMSTGDKSQVASLATKAGVSPTTMRHLLGSISREFDSTNGEGAMKDWTLRSAQESSESSGQNSLWRSALLAEKDSYDVISNLSRNAANAFETGADLDTLGPGLEVAKRLIQTNSLGELAAAAPTLRKAGIDQRQIDLLSGYMGDSQGLEDRLLKATQSNEAVAMEDSLMPLLLQGAIGDVELGGLGAQIGGIERLLGRPGE
jgi:hypothetical protein